MSLRSAWRKARAAHGLACAFAALPSDREMFVVPAGRGGYMAVADVATTLEGLAAHYEREGELTAALALRQAASDLQEGTAMHDALKLEVTAKIGHSGVRA